MDPMLCSALVLAVAVVGMVCVVGWAFSDRRAARKQDAATADLLRYLTEADNRHESAAMASLRDLYEKQSAQLFLLNETLLDRATKISEQELELRKAEAQRVTPVRQPAPRAPTLYTNGTHKRSEADVDVLLDAIEGNYTGEGMA